MLEYEIAPSEAAALVREGKARILDVREPWEFATAHVEGGDLMPMGELPSRVGELPSRVGELDPAERLVVLCHHGVRSMNATVWLRRKGFEQAQSVRGGIDAWAVEVDPKVPRY